LTEDVRHDLDRLIARAERSAKPSLAAPARTLAEARRLAVRDDDVGRGMVWEAEYQGWFIFAWDLSDGRPSLWFYGVAVRKDTRLVYRFGSW
jgi:hypothetical protein